MTVERRVGAVWKRLLAAAGTTRVRVGVPAGAGNTPEGLTYSQLAQWLHDGTDTIPARPFLAVPLDGRRTEVRSLMQRVSTKILNGAPPGPLLAALGQWGVQEVIRAINAGVPPPNAQSTIDRKGSSLPLVDTGVLKSKIDYAVVAGG